MQIVEPSVEIISSLPSGRDILKHIEKCGRVCYKSENVINDDSCYKFIEMILKNGHESVLEHFSFSVKFICDRGVSHEIVRHRIASHSQESSRYCNYSNDKFNNEVTFIKPCYFDEGTESYKIWYELCANSEKVYFSLLNLGNSPQFARAVLPNSLKTELVMTANIREWRHFLKLRCSDAAHPQMREVALMLLNKLKSINKVPLLFDNIYNIYNIYNII